MNDWFALFSFWGMLDSNIGLWRVLSQSFPHKAYINLSVPVPALAKANASLSNQWLSTSSRRNLHSV